MIRVETPIDEATIRSLHVGDEVSVTGTVITARDAAHKMMLENPLDVIRPYLLNGIIYHCGPVMRRRNGRWTVVAAGPTTSIREEPYEATVIEEYGVRAIIGKGGMGARTARALKSFGGAYLHAIGGAAVSIADSVTSVEEVFMLETLGAPEAFWVMRVDGLKTVVTMDAAGRSLHRTIRQRSASVRNQLIGAPSK